MGNSYYIKITVKVNLVKVTKIRLQKMKKNMGVASFYCLIYKIWKKITFSVVIRRESRMVCVVSLAQKTNITFLCRFVIKYS